MDKGHRELAKMRIFALFVFVHLKPSVSPLRLRSQAKGKCCATFLNLRCPAALSYVSLVIPIAILSCSFLSNPSRILEYPRS